MHCTLKFTKRSLVAFNGCFSIQILIIPRRVSRTINHLFLRFLHATLSARSRFKNLSRFIIRKKVIYKATKSIDIHRMENK